MRFRTRLLLCAPLLGAAAALQAASVDPRLFQELKWRSVGPFRGGRVLAVAGDPKDPKRFYFGAVNGGVWRTDDAGRTWTASRLDLSPLAGQSVRVRFRVASDEIVGTGPGFHLDDVDIYTCVPIVLPGAPTGVNATGVEAPGTT